MFVHNIKKVLRIYVMFGDSFVFVWIAELSKLKMVTKSSEKVTSVCIKYPNKSFYWGEKIIKFGHPKILKKLFLF